MTKDDDDDEDEKGDDEDDWRWLIDDNGDDDDDDDDDDDEDVVVVACCSCSPVIWQTGYATVVIDGKHSGWLSVTSGVPQGTLLGPAFFVSCINDMPRDLSHSSSLALFADDVKCFHYKNRQWLWIITKWYIDNLVEWSDEWKLVFNTDNARYSR